jgi:hypothetical protein
MLVKKSCQTHLLQNRSHHYYYQQQEDSYQEYHPQNQGAFVGLGMMPTQTPYLQNQFPPFLSLRLRVIPEAKTVGMQSMPYGLVLSGIHSYQMA